MRKLFLLATLALALGVAPAIARAADADGLPAAGKTFSISLNDGQGHTYCDFFDVTIQSNMLVPGLHNMSTNCGGLDTNVIGVVGYYFSVAPFTSAAVGITIGDPTNYVNGGGFGMTYVFNLSTKTWANYFWDGTTLTAGYSGGFTYGKPMFHSGRSSAVNLKK